MNTEKKKYNKKYPYPVGIDLGTSNSCAAIKVGNQIIIIEAKEGVSKQGKTLSSCVSFTEDQTLVGEFAKNRLVIAPQETVYQCKRYMGTNQTWNIRGKQYRPEQIAAFILAKIKEDTESQIEAEITEAVITVPAQFDDLQRKATTDAAKIAGLNCIRLINEPTAAALAYEADKTNNIILVADLGGGTFDVSILKYENDVFEVISTGGDTQLGGKDIDTLMCNYVISQIEMMHGIKIESNNVELMEKVRTAVETTKIELSNVVTTNLLIPFLCLKDNMPISINLPYTRALLESQISEIIKQVERTIIQTIDDANINKGQITKLILVGGPMHMPYLKIKIEKCVGIDASTSVNPNNCVALGAAKQAAMLANPEEAGNILLLDVTPLSLGLEVEGDSMSVLIKKNSNIPTRNVQTYTTAEDNQKSVEIRILQGERARASDNKVLHTFRLEGLPAMKRGTPMIDVTFEINSSGILEVSAEERSTKIKQKVTVTNNKNLTSEEIDKMILDAEANKQKDEAYKEKVEQIHRAKTVMNGIDELLKDDAAKLSEDERAKYEKYSKELEELTKGDDSTLIKQKVNEVETELNALLQNRAQASSEPNKTPEDNTTEVKPE
jgi:molecular chaperone DnaK